VDQVAHAFKHVIADWPREQRLHSTDVITRSPAIWGIAEWGRCHWGDPAGGVTLDTKPENDLLSVVKRAAEFLRQQRS
jgi:hypothetical protein